MRALIAYASKYGSTKGIAERIGEGMRQRGIDTEVQDVKVIGDLQSFDAFIVGSAVFMGHWMKEAREFISKNTEVLSKRPVWLFSSGPTGSSPTDKNGRDKLVVSGPTEVEDLKALTAFRAHKVFFGAMFPERLTGSVGFFYNLARRSKSARESMERDEGDFRDWKEIDRWADGIAEELITQTVNLR